MAFSLRFGNFLLEGCSVFQGSSPYRVTQHHFPRRPGSIAPRVPALDSKRISLQGEVWKDSEAQIIQYFELLGKKLDAGRDRLYLRDDNRFLNAVSDTFDWTFNAGKRPDIMAAYSLGFIADDPFWYAPQHSEQIETLTGAGTALTFAITNNGGARTPPVIQVTRTDPASDQMDVIITQTSTGFFLKWAGLLPDGATVVFDCVNRRVTALGGNGLAAFTGNIRIELEPGLNNFIYSGPGNVEIVVAWHERWAQS
jgi:hypothetical protein